MEVLTTIDFCVKFTIFMSYLASEAETGAYLFNGGAELSFDLYFKPPSYIFLQYTIKWKYSDINYYFLKHPQSLIPLMTGQPPKESALNRFRTGVDQVMEDFETYWLKDSKFIAGPHLTLADLFATCELTQLGKNLN